MQTLRVNNLRIATIRNGKFSGYYFYMNVNIWRDFQICINVPLILIYNLIMVLRDHYYFGVTKDTY